jgi:S1-C subfamily serine protease
VTRRVAGLLVAAGVALALPGCVAPPPEAGPPASLPSGRPELAAESARQRAAEVTMRVRNRSCDGVATGSGFAVGPRRLVTNRHLVEGAEELQLDTWDGRSVSVAVHRVAYLHDLALIETLEPLPRVALLAADDPEPRARVTAVGFPLGGPLLDHAGQVVGVIYAGETRTRYGLAIPVSTLRDLLGDRARLGVPEPCA